MLGLRKLELQIYLFILRDSELNFTSEILLILNFHEVYKFEQKDTFCSFTYIYI